MTPELITPAPVSSPCKRYVCDVPTLKARREKWNDGTYKDDHKIEFCFKHNGEWYTCCTMCSDATYPRIVHYHADNVTDNLQQVNKPMSDWLEGPTEAEAIRFFNNRGNNYTHL